MRGLPDAGPATLAIRPEQLQVRPLDDVDGVDAEVLDVSFFGHDATVRARVRGFDGFLTARTLADAVPRAGDRVRLRVVGEALCFGSGATPAATTPTVV